MSVKYTGRPVCAACFILSFILTACSAVTPESSIPETVQAAGVHNIPSATAGIHVASSEPETSAAFAEIADTAVPDASRRFYYSRLDKGLQEDIEAMYEAVTSFEKTCMLPNSVSAEEINMLVHVLLHDFPELFQINSRQPFEYLAMNDMVFEVKLRYTMDQESYEKGLRNCRKLIETIRKDAPVGNREAVEKYVYEYLAGTIEYTADTKNCGTAYGALIERQAKCDGISLAYEWLLREFGIESFVVSGKNGGDEKGHAWNGVRLDDGYYYVDLTSDLSSTSNLDFCIYPAFNVPLSGISSHYPLSAYIRDFLTLPSEEKDTRSFHIENGSYVFSGEETKPVFFYQLDRASAEDGRGWMQFASDEDFKAFVEGYGPMLEEWCSSRMISGTYQMSYLDDYRAVGFSLE